MTAIERQRHFFNAAVAGERGEYWKKDALKKLQKCIEDVESGRVIVEEDGAVKWASNGRYLMDDLTVVFECATSRVNAVATEAKRDEQTCKEIEAYRNSRKNRGYSDEEKFEMDAAFGPGHTIVDIFTGARYTTR